MTLPVLVVNDGHVLIDNLRASGRDLSWLQGQLKKRRLTSQMCIRDRQTAEEQTAETAAQQTTEEQPSED